MPNWSGTVLTAKGLALQAKVEAGTVMNITKLKIGDGVLGTGQTVAALSDLVHPIKIIDISALTPLANGTCKIHGIATNAGIEDGFYVRELGVFAQDPDVGEILYAYTADGSPDFLPPEGGPVAVSEELVINLAFSNTANITASIAMDGLVTVAVMQNAVNVHDNDPDAHEPAITKHNTSTSAHADLLHLRKNSTSYVVGDVKYSPTLPSYAYLECIQDGTTAATEPVWPAVGEEVTDGTVRWRVRDIKSGSGESIGSIKACLSNTPPPGWLALDTGAMISRATYPQLWAWVQENAPLITEAEWQAQAAVQSSVGAYSSGDGSTTFRLPRLLDYGRGGLAAEAGTWQEPTQVPDWVGNLSNPTRLAIGELPNNDGKIAQTLTQYQVPTTQASSAFTGYFSSVRPRTIKMLYCVKAFDAETNQGLIDITALANEVAGKQTTLGYVKACDQKASGTSGGTFTSGAWRTRELNQLKTYGNISGVSLSGNQLTIPAGTYAVKASAPGNNVDGHKIRLRNITAATTLSVGSTEQAAAPDTGDWVQTNSILGDVFTVAVTTVLELQHYSQSTFATYGFGSAMSSGEVETYAMLELLKIG
ncbi:phage tail protein [Sporomusa sphaeroides]|uniref:Uncharacterized protein n=1 Tax=Sporomusa sphaeroides DSM 2875 TaxID=1337886 RepID=A0ABP2C410_9FIRM|nr:phage tail protein [Sporomusa sphaeroides]OLS56356.1 hypothetical protein SPSPH_27490 [Sporomusa sphaeroides DSM 2875]CVK18451.1 hypothetical protein SSPH_01089 [Sporomusa sphaeroides DSM 2875]